MYKLGKTAARKDSVKLKLSDYLAPIKTPTKFGHYGLEPVDWMMLGNANYGCCVWSGAAHETMLWNKEANKDVAFTDTAVLSDYSKVTGFNLKDPNTDQGTDVQVAASYRLKTGITDGKTRHKIGAYVALDRTKAQLKQAIYLFSAVGIGIQFPASAMTQFNNGKPWTVVSGSSIEGGHYIPAVGYDSKYVYIVTWGRVQKMSWGFFTKYSDEGIIYLSQEFLTGGKSLEGFNLTQLQADLKTVSS